MIPFTISATAIEYTTLLKLFSYRKNIVIVAKRTISFNNTEKKEYKPPRSSIRIFSMAKFSIIINGNINAIKYIEDFSTKSDQLVSPASIAALGNCYAKTGNIDKAISLLKKAAEKADNNSLSPIFYIQAGELLESQGKKDEALKLYQIVKSKYALSAEAATIDKYIERASAH